ncbi:MAG: hypothetical protein J0H75_05680 [Rhizobiales bacterium]|nr:hypothetical protein [Hyphomicrobiales bacterium]
MSIMLLTKKVMPNAIRMPRIVANPGMARGSPLWLTPQSTHTKNAMIAI